MATVLKRVSLISFVVVLVAAISFEMRCPKAIASDGATSDGGHTVLTRKLGPIELGASQEARCKRTIADDRIRREECALARRLLASMDAEPRDKVWADEMELNLRDWVESRASDGFTLRNVKCRLSWCVVEVGSTQGRILSMSPNDQRKRKLFDVRDLFAPDVDDPNVQDQVIFYKRYCNSAGELFDGSGHLTPNFIAVGQNC